MKVKTILDLATTNENKEALIIQELLKSLDSFYKEIGNKLISSDLPCKERALELMIEIKKKYDANIRKNS